MAIVAEEELKVAVKEEEAANTPVDLTVRVAEKEEIIGIIR